MKVLDLFSGLGGWNQAFRDRGHEVFTVDINPDFNPDLEYNILSLGLVPKIVNYFDVPDIILASPPCEKFSVMTVGRYWNKDNTPKRPEAQEAIDIVKATLEIIERLNPKFWVMENPVGKLRKLDFMQEYENRTVTYCRLGEPYMKPTDLWGKFPPSLVLPAKCKNGNPDPQPAPRGAKIGVQANKLSKFRGGMISDMIPLHSRSPERLRIAAERAKIPYQLSLLVCEAAERDLHDTN